MATGATKEFLGIGDFIDLQGSPADDCRPLAAYGGMQATLFGGDEPVRVVGSWRDAGIVRSAARAAGHGPADRTDDLRQGAPPVVMISYELWQTRFGSDPNIIGRGVQLNATRRPVVGVAAARLPFSAELADRSGRCR